MTIHFIRMAAAVALALAWTAPASAHPDTPRRLEEVARELITRPGAPDLLFRRGCLLLDEEYADYPQALADLTAALQAPEIADVRLFRGTALLRLGRLKEALEDLDRFVRDQPRDARGYERRFEARLAAGRRREALRDLEAAIEIEPRTDLYSRLAAAHAEDGEPARAVRVYEDGVRRLGRPLELVVALVDLATRERLHEKALEWLAVLEAEGGRPERWRLARAEVLEAAGRAADARALYQEVIRLLEARVAAGGVLTQPMRLEQAVALAGLGRKNDARAIAASLGEAVKGRAEYQRLAARLAR